MKHYFRPYRNYNIFIETGSANGEGITAALNAGFPIIYSIELSNSYFTLCKELFKQRKEVHLEKGNSVKVLPRLLHKINEPCVVWLDAHHCGGNTEGLGIGIPLMDELRAINEHYIKIHTILIDDLREIRSKSEGEWANFNFTINDIINYILQINPNYKISYEDVAYGDLIFKDDILIAQI